jgi:NAD(P)H-hydrate repair Nnr-like enzyme with NAD(P)H-hydrate epimerase domain
LLEQGDFTASIDGLLGMRVKLPLRPRLAELVSVINRSKKIGVRVAVDLPTGIGEDS